MWGRCTSLVLSCELTVEVDACCPRVALGADLLEAGRGAGLGKDANALTGREIRRSGCPPRGQEKKHLTVKKKAEQGTRSPTMDVVAPTVSQGVFAAWQIREVQEQGSGADATKMETELL